MGGTLLFINIDLTVYSICQTSGCCEAKLDFWMLSGQIYIDFIHQHIVQCNCMRSVQFVSIVKPYILVGEIVSESAHQKHRFNILPYRGMRSPEESSWLGVARGSRMILVSGITVLTCSYSNHPRTPARGHPLGLHCVYFTECC